MHVAALGGIWLRGVEVRPFHEILQQLLTGVM